VVRLAIAKLAHDFSPAQVVEELLRSRPTADLAGRVEDGSASKDPRSPAMTRIGLCC
jgi:hypothetical protein